jgi:hypothetical protein
MAKKMPASETIAVKNNLGTVADTAGAVDLFSRILNAVREERETRRGPRTQKSGRTLRVG